MQLKMVKIEKRDNTKLDRLACWLLIIAGVGICPVGQYSLAQEPRERAKRDAHGEVICMALTADGKTLATGTWDRVTLWDVASGKELHALKRHNGAIGCVAVSPNAKVLASGSVDKTIKLWDVASGKELRTLTGHTERVSALRSERASMKGHRARVWSVAFSPDGRILASGSWDGTIEFWDVATGQPQATFKAHTNRVYKVAFTMDGSTLVSGGGIQTARGEVKLWDMTTSEK